MSARTAMLAATLVLAAACSSKSSLTNQGTGTTTYVATLRPSNEVPPNTETSSGTATFTLAGTSMGYTVYATGLSAAASMSHIHLGAAGANGPVIFPFAVTAGTTTGTLATGTIDLTQSIFNGTISGDSLKVLFNNGNIYVNVHTPAHGGGEIRGQIVKQ
ncbi:MAG TPA: CHRD domain-containing protein [Gemmatimonadaceae bacterium]|nr:CHRD domain-containing protein [Gemmatimonadaceae bacterium]